MVEIIPAYTIPGGIPGKGEIGKEGVQIYEQGILMDPDSFAFTGFREPRKNPFYPIEIPSSFLVPELTPNDIPIIKTCLYLELKKEGVFIPFFALNANENLVISSDPDPQEIEQDKVLVLWQINATRNEGHTVGKKRGIKILQEGKFKGKDARNRTSATGKSLLLLIERGGKLVVTQNYFQWIGRSSHFTLLFPEESETPIAFAEYNNDYNAGKMMIGKSAEKRV